MLMMMMMMAALATCFFLIWNFNRILLRLFNDINWDAAALNVFFSFSKCADTAIPKHWQRKEKNTSPIIALPDHRNDCDCIILQQIFEWTVFIVVATLLLIHSFNRWYFCVIAFFLPNFNLRFFFLLCLIFALILLSVWTQFLHYCNANWYDYSIIFAVTGIIGSALFWSTHVLFHL